MTNKQTKLTNYKATLIAEGVQEPDYPGAVYRGLATSY